MFDRLRIVSVLGALVALAGCSEELGDGSDSAQDDEVEATVDPLIAPEGSGSGNMLTNPGFENALSSGDWWLGNNASRSGTARHYGSYGLRLTGIAFMLHKDVVTTAGAKYTISASARKSAYGTTPCWMEVQFYPSGGVYKTAGVSSTDWKTFGVTVVAPAGTTSARVQLKRDPGTSSTSEACYWDDVSFRRVY